ncbi:Retrovirus-related Pol polyprotein from transposon 17.6, partial [Mucuna pruriens]
MLIERGIEANPEKCQAVVNVRSPQSVKEVQQFIGRVTALSRFISRAVETAMPIFGTLKKRGKFVRTPECEEAFLRLKAMMAALPVLIRPCPGTPLYLYISVFDAIGAEKRYKKIDKAALALVMASRRLRPYFQNFSIIVRTDLPIRQVLRKPDLVGRMIAWSVQWSEFDNSFERRGHVKAQALANFITKLTPDGPPTADKGDWYLSVNGSSNQAGSGAGVILEGPNGVLIEQSLHFNFRASNNQVEYEALLAGMRLARELDAKNLTAKSDSRLVTGQVNNEYQTRDPQLTKYREQAVKLEATFEKFVLVHVPRDQNERADLLAKLTSTKKKGQGDLDNSDSPVFGGWSSPRERLGGQEDNEGGREIHTGGTAIV